MPKYINSSSSVALKNVFVSPKVPNVRQQKFPNLDKNKPKTKIRFIQPSPEFFPSNLNLNNARKEIKKNVQVLANISF